MVRNIDLSSSSGRRLRQTRGLVDGGHRMTCRQCGQLSRDGLKKGSAPINSAPAFNCDRTAKAAAISRLVLAQEWTCRPSRRPPPAAPQCGLDIGICRVDQDCNASRRGTSSCKSPAALPQAHVHGDDAGDVAARSVEAGDKTSRTGSLPVTNTIGIAAVAALAARAAAMPPVAAMTDTCRLTKSAAIAGSRSFRPSAQRYSIATFRPST